MPIFPNRAMACLLAVLLLCAPIVPAAAEDALPYTETVYMHDLPIFTGPGYDYQPNGSVHQAGVYTIVEEAADGEGNLWGRLKSGAGWIDLTYSRAWALAAQPLSAGYAPYSLLNAAHPGLMHRYTMPGSESPTAVVFHAYEPLSSLRLVTLDFADEGYLPGETLFSLHELTPTMPLVADLIFFGDMTAYGVTFKDSSGKERFYSVSISGRNGQLILTDENAAPAAPAAAPADEASAGLCMRVINCEEWVSLRAAPDTAADRLLKLPLGAEVTQCEYSDNGFIYCCYNGQWGYVLAEYLQPPEGTPAGRQRTLTLDGQQLTLTETRYQSSLGYGIWFSPQHFTLEDATTPPGTFMLKGSGSSVYVQFFTPEFSGFEGMTMLYRLPEREGLTDLTEVRMDTTDSGILFGWRSGLTQQDQKRYYLVTSGSRQLQAIATLPKDCGEEDILLAELLIRSVEFDP